MKSLLAFLLLAFSFASPIAQIPGSPGPVSLTIVAVGDTVKLRVGWGPGDHATSYLFTTAVSATNGSWVVVADSNASGKWITGPGMGPLPATGEITTTSYKTWITAIPWDSATFSVTVASKNAAGLSPAVVGYRRIVRLPGPPGPVIITDSVVGMLVRPEHLILMKGGFAAQVCAFPQFSDSAVAVLSMVRSACTPFIDPMWKSASLTQQAVANGLCIQWSSSDVTVATVTSDPCSVGLGWREVWRISMQRGRFTAQRIAS